MFGRVASPIILLDFLEYKVAQHGCTPYGLGERRKLIIIIKVTITLRLIRVLFFPWIDWGKWLGGSRFAPSLFSPFAPISRETDMRHFIIIPTPRCPRWISSPISRHSWAYPVEDASGPLRSVFPQPLTNPLHPHLLEELPSCNGDIPHLTLELLFLVVISLSIWEYVFGACI